MSYTLYNSAEVEKILRDLVPSQESIEQASDAFLTLGENGFIKRLVEDWDAYFHKFSTPEHYVKRLSLLYLANDIIQKCKSRAPGYLDGFKNALIRGLRFLITCKDEHNIQPALQLVELWKNRRVYPKEVTKEMSDILSDQSVFAAKKDEKERGGLEIPEGLIHVPQELIPFIDATKDLEKWIIKTGEAENKLRNNLRDDYFNEDEVNLHLSEYKKCVELEQKYRTNLLKSEMELLRNLDTDHIKYTHMMKKIGGLIDDIERNF